MARIQLENRLDVTLRRLLFTGRAYTVEPPTTIPPNALIFWQTDDTGGVTYEAVSSDAGGAGATAGSSSGDSGGVTAPSPAQPAAPEGAAVPPAITQPSTSVALSSRLFTLTWQFSLTGRPTYQTQNVDPDFRIDVRQISEGALYTVSSRSRRRVPPAARPRRATPVVIAIVAAVVLLTTASAAAFGINSGRLFRPSTQVIPTATWTPTPTPTTPTITPIPPSLTITVRSSSLDVGPGEQKTLSATCQSGEVLVGGGFADNQFLTVDYSYPANDTTWSAFAFETDSLSSKATVYAVCAQANFPLGVQILASQPSSNGSATVTCPPGTLATGGGAKLADIGYVDQSFPDANGWSATTPTSGSGGPASITAYALCASSDILKVGTVVTGFTVPTDGLATGSAGCPSGDVLVSAGYNYQGGEIFVYKSEPQGAQAASWSLTVSDRDFATSSTQRLVLVCLSY